MGTNTTGILLWDSANKLRPLFVFNNMEIIERLIERKNELENSIAQEKSLYFASHFGEHERVKYLLEQGYSPNVYTQGYKQTPLHVCYDEKVAKMLIEYGADLNPENQEGETPYEFINFCYCSNSLFNHNGDYDDVIAREEAVLKVLEEAMDAEGIEYMAQCEADTASY